MRTIISHLARIACLVLFLVTNSNATHLMGGNLTYEYLGSNGAGGFNYRVTLTIYRLCDPGSSQLPNSTQLGAYQDNPSNPTGNKDRIATAIMPLISQQFITPPNANDSCTFAPSVCVEEGIYQTTITLPSSTSNYYLISDRCCRNNNIANIDLPSDAGQAYYALVPPTSVVNNSPTFAAAPVPFICANDTVSILNQAIDADGDSLVYSFVTPYNGIAGPSNPSPNPPLSYTWPIPEINYPLGYSNTQPFGAGGYVTIDGATGLASYLSPNQGFYVVAVEILEYRNGVLIGTTRRDIQLIVITCPANPAPTLAVGATQTTYTIQEGQTLCFNVSFTDSNGDSLYTTHTGDIFNSLITNPAATYSDVAGFGTISSQFCWTTSCAQGRTNPYQFSVNAIDNGCPAKTTNIVYTINVIPAQKPTVINGPDTLCINSATGIAYNVAGTAGYTYNWQILQGNQVSGTNTTAIGVNFNQTGNATVSVVAVNPFGCTADTLRKTVYIKAQPTAIAGSDIDFCSGGTATIGTSSTSGYSYSWSPATGLSNTTISNPVVTLTNTGQTAVSTSYIVTTTLNGCTNKDTIVVTANPYPIANAGNNVSICSGNSVPLGTLSTTGYTYNWTPSTGLSNGSVANPILTLSNNDTVPDTLSYVVVVNNAFSCISSDTVVAIVRPIPNAVAGSDITFCSGGTGTIGASAVSGYTYSWSPSTGLNSSTTSSPQVTLNNTGTVNDTVSIILTTGWFGCTDKDTVKVVVRPIPVANAGNNMYLCSGLNGVLGTLSTTGYTYSWSPSTGLSNSNISNPVVNLVNNGNSLDTTFYVVSTTLNGCTSTDTVRVVVGPVPVAEAGLPQFYCSGQQVTLGSTATSGYTYVWSPTTGLSNTTISNPTTTATNTGTSPLIINYAVITTWFGCKDTDSVAVTILPLPISNAGNDQLLCSGNTINLGTSNTGGYSYNWSPANGLNNTTISNPQLNLTTTNSLPDTLYYVVVTELGGCTTTDSARIVLSPVPIADAGVDTIFCSGQTVAIGLPPTTNYNYSWSPSTGISPSNSSQPNLTLTNSTNAIDTIDYIMTTNLFGCIDKDTIVVRVKPLPLSEAGNSTSLCNGDTIQIGTASTAGYTYDWSPGQALSDSLISDPSIIVTNTGTSPVITTYTVTTMFDGCESKDSISLTVHPLPNVTASSNDLIICIGDAATLNASGANSYSWAELLSPTVSIGTGVSITVTPTTTTDYILTGTSAATCINYDTIQVVVNPLPAIQITSANDTICDGDTITLNANGGLTYQWLNSTSGNIIGTDDSVQVNPTSATTYILTGIDNNQCINRDTIDITVNPAATLTGINGTLSVCPGVVGVPYWVNNPNGTSTYNWTITNGVLASGQSTDSITVDWQGTSGIGVISIYETTDLGCSSPIVDQPVNINPILTPIAPAGVDVLCANNANGIVYSTLNTPGSTYNWFIQGGNITSGFGTNSVVVDWTNSGPSVNAIWYEESSITADTVCFGVSDTLYVTLNPVPNTSAITGNNSVCINDTTSFNVTNTNGSSYNWSVTDGLITGLNGTNNINIHLNTVGTSVVTVQETNQYGCLGNLVNYLVTVNALPNAYAGIDTTICNGGAALLSASGGVNYIWTPSSSLDNSTISNPIATPNTTTTYIVEVEDANLCKQKDTVTVNVNALPIITASNNVAICLGTNTTLNATGGNSYVWSPGSDLSDSLIASPVATPTTTTTYTVIGTDNNGCSNSSSVQVSVNPLPVANAGNNVTICNGSSTTLTGNGASTYSWSPATGLDDPTSQNPIANPTTTTIYTVTATDLNGCTDDAQVEVTVNDQPVALFQIDASQQQVNCNGVTITLNNSSTDALQYWWSFGDGATSVDVNPTHLYGFSGELTITLVAINNMCTDTSKIAFIPGDLSDFLNNIPNIFTPNNDQMNDCYSLAVNTDFEACTEWKVFNRWGTKVFQSSTTQPCWNGKKDNNGEDLPTGTYFYVLIAGGKEYKGSVSLAR